MTSEAPLAREHSTSEDELSGEGFSFLQLSGNYAQYGTHRLLYPSFAKNVEDLIRNETKYYIVAVTPKTPNGTSGIGSIHSPAAHADKSATL